MNLAHLYLTPLLPLLQGSRELYSLMFYLLQRSLTTCVTLRLIWWIMFCYVLLLQRPLTTCETMRFISWMEFPYVLFITAPSYNLCNHEDDFGTCVFGEDLSADIRWSFNTVRRDKQLLQIIRWKIVNGFYCSMIYIENV